MDTNSESVSNFGDATTAVPSRSGTGTQHDGPPTTTRAASQFDVSSTSTEMMDRQQYDSDSVPTLTSPSFRGSKICVAIDVSGSTYGDILNAEKRATQAICKLVPYKLRPSIKIVPWNDTCGEPVDLQHIHSLHSDGGTNPNVFLNDAASRDCLQEADFWFLMTDGEIDESVVRQFARGIRAYGLHGKACIVCLFGEGDVKPALCNVSVGISVFAGSPHAAFLFSDVETGKTYILQTKGCFSALLPHGEGAPRLGEDTTWDDLPQTSFENLSRVHVPSSVVVGANEIILQDNTRLDMAAFLRDLPEDENTVARILDDEENLNTIAVMAKLREETGRLRSWLDRLDAKYGEAMPEVELAPAPEVQVSSESRSTKVTVALSKLDLRDDSARKEDDNDDSVYHPVLVDHTSGHVPRISTRSSGRRDSISYMHRLSISGLELASDNLGRPGPFKFSAGVSNVSSNRIRSAPGFAKSRRQGSQFRSDSGCRDCAKNCDISCLLVRVVPKNLTTHLPSVGTQSIVHFPLAMGNYAETDILASSVVCDACAVRYVHQRRSKHHDTIVASLPLVSYSDNRTVWLDTIDNALSRRFHVSQLPTIFLGILCIKLERLVLEEQEHILNSDLCDAIKWLANMLLSEVVLQSSKIATINRFGIGALHDVLLRSFTSTRSNPLYTELLQYPLDGFVVANAALSNSRHGRSFSGSKRKNVVFLKLLYHLTEGFMKFRSENDAIVTEAAKSLLLLNDEPTGPSSLFKWQEIRSLSMYAKEPNEIRKYLAQRGSYKMSLTIKDLEVTPFLSEDSLQSFERLGVLFNWITGQASHATAVFAHHLFRTDLKGASVQEWFTELREVPDISEVLKDPADVSAKKVDRMIKGLPPI